MRQKTKLLNKLLTIVLSLMMIFSSVLVSKTNIVLAEVNEEESQQEELPEIKEEENKSEELSPEVIVNQEETLDESKSEAEGEASSDITSTPDDATNLNDGATTNGETLVDDEENKNPEVVEEENETPMMVGMGSPALMNTPKLGGGLLSALFGRKSTSFTVTFVVDNKEYKPTNDFDYKEVEKGSSIPKPTNPTKEGYLFKGWFIREKDDLLGLIKSEVIFNFSDDSLDGEDTVNKNITLYAKFEKESNANTYYNFRVKHVDSYGKTVDEFLASGKHTGENILKDGDYIYSFYSYYKQAEYQSILRDFVNILQGTGNFDKTWVIDYQYQMYEDQFVYAVVNNVSEIDSNGKGKVTNFEDSKYIGKSYTVIGTEALYDEQGNVINENGTLVKIGDYYTGNAFDLAIQDANDGDIIELLDNLYVTTPIEIWADVNLDLNGKTVLYDENSVGLDILHYIDRKTRKSDIIVPDYIPATILVTNANVKISNGTVRNTNSKGRGIIDISFDEDYKLTLEDVEVIVDGASNTNNYAVQAGYDLIDKSGIVASKQSGFIDVLSGTFNGYFLNTNDGRLTLYHGVQSKYDPRYIKGTTNDNGVTFEEHYQAYNNGDSKYPWVIYAEPEARVYGDIATKEYRTLLEAVQDTASNNGCTIKLLKDINLNKVSYATNGSITLDGNSYYQIDLNNHTILGNSINITNGTAWFTGNGYVKTNIYVKDSGSLEIDSGSYYSIFNNTTRSNAIAITGGSFIDNLPKTFFDETNYECLYNNVPTYKYSVVAKLGGKPITITYDGISEPKGCSTFDEAMDYVSSLSNKTNILVKLNADVQTNSTIEIDTGLTLDLYGHTLTSKPEYNEAECVGLTTIYVDIDDTVNDTLTIKGTNNGTIVNSSLAEDSDDVYGVYVKQGNVNIEDINLNIRTPKCSNGYAIYNSEDNDGVVNVTSSNIALVDNVVAYDSIETIHNDGTMNINGSRVYAGNSCGEISAIYNDGNLEIVDSHIDADGSSAISANVYAINSSGNVHINKTSSGETKIVANNENGKAYGIYQRYLKANGIKTIKVENGSEINVTADNGVANGTQVYGIYTNKANNNNYRTDVLLGKCKFYVSSPHNKAVGVYAAGGYIYSGTVNNGDLSEGMFDKVDASMNPVNVHDNIYADEFDRFAIFELVGANNSIGIDCEYGTAAKVANQITNAIIRMNCTGDSSYCVKASNSIIGVDIISGYYYSIQDNRMMSGRVFCKDGYYNRDVSLNASTNHKCIRTLETDTRRYCSYDKHNYEYTIEGSNCTLTVSAYTTDQIALKIMIEYDPAMLLEKDKYGIKITVEDIISENEPIYSFGMTIADYEKDTKCIMSDGKYVYNCPIPIKMISNNVKVEICSFENGVDTHTYHLKKTFSCEQYFYDMLNNKVKRSDEVRDLAVASLNLGSYAQDYFEYWLSGNPANKANHNVTNYYDAQSNLYSPTVTHNVKIDSEQSHKNESINYEEAIEYLGHSLELGAETSLRFYFNLKSINGTSYNIADYKFESRHTDSEGKNKVCDLTPGISDGKYYVDNQNISLLEITDLYEIVITNTKTGKVYTVAYSPIDYIIYTTTGEYVTNKTNEKLTALMNAYYECYLKSLAFDFTKGA